MTDELNGGRKIVEFYLDSGELVRVSPLSFYIFDGLNQRAEKLYPDLDKKLYEKPLDPEVSVFPDQVIPAEQNPEYQQAMAELTTQRRLWVADQIISLSSDFPAGKKALISKYAKELEGFSAVMDIPDDKWEATLKLCILRTEQDRLNILHAARNALLLTEGEVRDGMRLFRPILRTNGRTDVAGNQPATATPEEQISQRQSADE